LDYEEGGVMCGLFGWQWAPGKVPSKRARQVLATELAQGADKRGGQSWGVWSPQLVLRGIGKAADHSSRFAGLHSLFGHSRWATHGANVIQNTHPFISGDMALSHNGVINNHRNLNQEHNRDFEVDSQHILQHLVDAKPLTDLQGYGAITWAIPSEPSSIYMGLLSSSGSLCVYLTEFGIVWSSTDETARKALKAAGIKIEYPYEIDAGQAYYADAGLLYSDSSLPSLLVRAPAVFRGWESFGSAGGSSWARQYGLSDSYYADMQVSWCQEHKKRYSRCPCRGSQPSHIYIKEKDVPKDGEDYVKPPDPAPTAPANIAAVIVGRDKEYKPPCRAIGCHEPQSGFNSDYCGIEHYNQNKPTYYPHEYRQCVFKDCRMGVRGGALCSQHREAQPATNEGKSAQERINERIFCTAAHCFEYRAGMGDLCKSHREEEDSELGSSAVSQDLRSAWAQKQPQPSRVRDTVQSLARWWLETTHGLADTEGEDGDDVVDFAIQMGFDVEEAMHCATNPDEGEANADSSQDEADVSVPPGEREPEDGGGTQTLVRSAGQRAD
jgi:hypothetical protein